MKNHHEADGDGTQSVQFGNAGSLSFSPPNRRSERGLMRRHRGKCYSAPRTSRRDSPGLSQAWRSGPWTSFRTATVTPTVPDRAAVWRPRLSTPVENGTWPPVENRTGGGGRALGGCGGLLSVCTTFRSRGWSGMNTSSEYGRRAGWANQMLLQWGLLGAESLGAQRDP